MGRSPRTAIPIACPTVKKDYLDARRFLYDMYLQNKDYDGAIKVIQDYLRADEKDLINLSYLGDVYVLKGDTGQARAAFQKMMDLEPQNPQGYLKMSLLNHKLKQPEEAIKNLKTALKKQPDFVPGLRLLITIHHEQKKPDKALEAARRTLAASPRNPELQQVLGEVLLSQNNPRKPPRPWTSPGSPAGASTPNTATSSPGPA